jgi:hypothetical protein
VARRCVEREPLFSLTVDVIGWPRNFARAQECSKRKAPEGGPGLRRPEHRPEIGGCEGGSGSSLPDAELVLLCATGRRRGDNAQGGLRFGPRPISARQRTDHGTNFTDAIWGRARGAGTLHPASRPRCMTTWPRQQSGAFFSERSLYVSKKRRSRPSPFSDFVLGTPVPVSGSDLAVECHWLNPASRRVGQYALVMHLQIVEAGE